jgi:hypothetical protein
MKSKKRLLGTIGIVFLVVFLFAGCAHTYQYSKETLPEQQSTLTWSTGYITTVALDEVSVTWKGGSILAKTTVSLPAGPHTLTVNYDTGSWFTRWMASYSNTYDSSKRASAVHVSHVFEPGKTYNLTYLLSGNSISFSITETN